MRRSTQVEALHGFMSSFKQFEKKLDKLQTDVNFHGNTLSDLRAMVINLSGGMTPYALKNELDDAKKRKTVGLQYEPEKEKPKRAGADTMKSAPVKPKAKSLPGHKYGLAKPAEVPLRSPMKASLPVVVKINRQVKAKPNRKPTIRKETEKRRKHLHKK